MLNLICTPIGNLNDLSFRAKEVLSNSDEIYAEDTRVTRKLLDFYNIKKPCISYHDHNERGKTDKLIKKLKAGIAISIVSDAGSPLISDPGFYLLSRCIEENIGYTVIPGPSSVTSAIVLSGLSADSFIFLGFFPRKNKQKQSLISRLKNETSTMIFFESTKRIKATINYISDHIDQDRQIVICREISKKYEEVLRGNKIFFKDYLNQKDLKGEIVLLIEGSSGEKTIHIDEGIKKSYLEKLSPKDAAKLLALVLNKSKREIYNSLIDS